MQFKTQLKHFTLLAEFKGTSKTGEGVSISIIDNKGIDLDTIRQKGQGACGDCQHARPTGQRKQGACYVYSRPGGSQGALGGLAKAFSKAEYLTLNEFNERVLVLAQAANYARIGKFGDPAADNETATAIKSILKLLRANNVPYTGYTHQWTKAKASELTGLLMASTESVEESAEARELGWSTFQVIGRKEEPTQIHCPAQEKKEAFKRGELVAIPTCKECQLCDGSKLLSIQVKKH